MDYCSFCRRHLNGALTCPGCGIAAPAPWDRPRAGRPGPVNTRNADALNPTPHRSAPPTTGVAAPVEAADANPYRVPAGEGRAARRRQAARGKRRRYALAGASLAAVALVGGLLTAGSLPRESPAAAHSVAVPALNDPVDTGHITPTSSAAAHAHRTSPSPARHRTRGASPHPTTATLKTTPVASPPHHHPAPTHSTGPAPRPPVGTTPPPAPPTESATATPSPSSSTGGPTSTPTATPTTPAQPPSGPTTAPTTTPKPVCILVLCIG